MIFILILQENLYLPVISSRYLKNYVIIIVINLIRYHKVFEANEINYLKELDHIYKIRLLNSSLRAFINSKKVLRCCLILMKNLGIGSFLIYNFFLYIRIKK